MMTIEERMAKCEKKVQQKEHQHLLKVNRAQETQKKLNRRRQRELGKIVLEYFPNLGELTPRTTAEENSLEFAEFRELMASLAEILKQGKKLDCETLERSLKYGGNDRWK